jgi:hypothetical protein
MDPSRLTLELERLADVLWAETERLATLAEEAAVAEVRHKTAFAKELLQAEGSVAVREAQATCATEELHMARRVAEARLQAQRELLATLRAEIDAVRTLNASARAATG